MGPRDQPRTPSIGGGLPLLLLSVLPPVIPRASWPSAVQELPMRRSVTFSSQPKLNHPSTSQHQQPIIDFYNFRLRPDGVSDKVGVLGKIRSFFGSRNSVRKSSAASYSGNSNIASALKVHMGYIAGLVPGSTKTNMASSCNTSTTGINRLEVSMSNKDLSPRRQSSYTRAGGSGPIISVTADYDEEALDFRRKLSLGLGRLKKEEPDSYHVNFQIPLNENMSVLTQHSQPSLSFRERAKGSPRFPHRIVPTSSLNALEDRRRSSGAPVGQQSAVRRSSQQPPNVAGTKKRMSLSQQVVPKWKSMEDASTTVLPGSRRGSGVLALSILPSNVAFQPRAASYSPNCDVWATGEYGIPFSELGKDGSKSPQNEPPQ